jgi:hypothetical protein
MARIAILEKTKMMILPRLGFCAGRTRSSLSLIYGPEDRER